MRCSIYFNQLLCCLSDRRRVWEETPSSSTKNTATLKQTEPPASPDLTSSQQERSVRIKTTPSKHLPVTWQNRNNNLRQDFFFFRAVRVSTHTHTHVYRSEYSLLYSAGYRQRSGAGLVNTVQGHVWQVVVIAVTLDLPWRQAVVVCVCWEDRDTDTGVSGNICSFDFQCVCVCSDRESYSW